ncbi:MAG: hypothetical protein ACI37Z_08900 [Candidatus Gastranaerophilaceae bacterium]|uniref:hypothetical protein n=1 Tax=Ruminococcus intestinalis TaxID=2763066 RepID=UPI0025FFAFC4|nr:hypothetical protein [uncultured Ruminococcus sp.]
MKKEKLKKYSIRFGVAFFIVLAFLTYFSSTIDNMLLPQVKVTQISYGTIDGNQSSDDRYLIPISAVIAMGDTGSVFVTRTDENNKTTVSEATVNIENSDDLYYEVTSDDIYGGIEVVYSTSKSISNGDRVHIAEEE